MHVFSGSLSQEKLPLVVFAVLGFFLRPSTFSPKHYFPFFAPSKFLFLYQRVCYKYDRLLKHPLSFSFLQVLSFVKMLIKRHCKIVLLVDSCILLVLRSRRRPSLLRRPFSWRENCILCFPCKPRKAMSV